MSNPNGTASSAASRNLPSANGHRPESATGRPAMSSTAGGGGRGSGETFGGGRGRGRGGAPQNRDRGAHQENAHSSAATSQPQGRGHRSQSTHNNRGGRGGPPQNFRGRGQDRPNHHFDPKPKSEVTPQQATAYLNRLSELMPQPLQAQHLATKVSSEIAEQLLRLLISTPTREQEKQLLWLFSQSLFVGATTTTVNQLSVASANNLLLLYWASDAFSADRFASATLMGTPETRLRYLMILRKVRDTANSPFIGRLENEDVLRGLELMITQTELDLGVKPAVATTDAQKPAANTSTYSYIPSMLRGITDAFMGAVNAAPAQTPVQTVSNGTATSAIGQVLRYFENVGIEHLVAECRNMRTVIVTIRRDTAQRQSAKRPTLNQGPKPDDDPNYRQVHVTQVQNTNFRVSFSGTRVEPTLAELKAAPAEAARQIVVGAPITSFLHHLDTVFHATRNDALQPLREGVQYLFINDMKMPRNKADRIDVKLFSDLEVSTVSATPDHGVIFIFFSKSLKDLASKRKNVLRRRLLPGNIVVLTNDRLHTGEVCVLVRSAKYDPEKGFICLRRAEIGAGREDDSLGPLKNISATYTLIESSVYWETHVHSLKAIKNLENPALVGGRIFENVRCLDVPRLRALEGMPADFVHTFDETQAEAFKHILNSEAPIVQGPPGTGKTYIGVCAVKYMLESGRFPDGPILVVCYTNHALDSFMEDILNSTAKLEVGNCYRLGYNSKTEDLKKYQLGDLDPKSSYGFQFQRKRLEEQWEEALSAQYVPVPTDGIPSSACTFFMALFKDKGNIMTRAKAELQKANSYLEALESDYEKKERNEKTRKEHKEHVGDAKEWIKEREAAFAQATENLETYLLQWRDAAGRPPRNAPNNAPVVAEESSESSDDDGIGEENVDRFIEEDGQADRAERAHRHVSIQRVAVARPAFLDAPGLDCNTLNAAQRHELYHYLLDNRLQKALPEMAKTISDVSFAASRRKGAVSDAQIEVLKKAKLIGATTTGLSKHLQMLTGVGIQCVILEEAAEIPECHALAAIIPGIQRFIQIGDHQQLRPKISCIESNKFNLNISLMERMLSCNNGCKTLAIQRRMRPEICNFIRPMYEDRLREARTQLLDHSNVKKYPSDASDYGLLDKNGFVLYINHSYPESVSDIGVSYENKAEAEFATHLAVYITKQRPESSVVILVPYTGQLQRVREVFRRKDLAKLNLDNKIRVVSIDDFQGEESDVVILSLTRSNTPGFFRENNRICVALSRARHLQVVVGNFKCFEHQKKCFWPLIIERARNNTPAGVSTNLKLMCQHHKTVRDFSVGVDPFETGLMSKLCGCTEQCNQKRDCGHMCDSICHGNVECSEIAKCHKTCGRVGSHCTASEGAPARTCDHECLKLCWEVCGQCVKMVQTKCKCGADVTLECHKVMPDTYYRECTATVKAKLRCSHIQKVTCYEMYVNSSTVVCSSICGKKLDDCEHNCKHKCHHCFDPRNPKPTWSHGPCKNPCTKSLVCGHVCTNPCSSICAPCAKPCEYICEHHTVCKKKSKKHNCGMSNQCINCTEKCGNRCKHSQCTKNCHEECNRKQCNERCTELLECNHQCRGLCGEQCLSRCFVCEPWTDEEAAELLFDEDNPEAILIELPCKHIIDLESMDTHMRIQTDYTERAITYPKCPKCAQLVVWGPTVNRYKGMLNKARKIVNKAKEVAIKHAETAAAELKQSEEHLDAMIRVSGDRDKFATVSNLPGAIQHAEAIRKRLVEAGPNLQLSNSLCHRINLLWVIYCITAETGGSDGPLDRYINTAIEKLQSLIPNADKADLDEVVKVAFLSILARKGVRIAPESSIEELAKQVAMSRGLSDQERRSIYDALASAGQIQRSGAFKTCPCGFVYVIGDCGGAMEVANCPECGHRIGGQQHRDAVGVRHNGEFDGSNQPAWPQ